MSAQVEIIIIAILVSITCAIPGVFLVLRKMALAADSITHSMLLGIVVSFFLVKDLNSPILIVGATLVGVITMWLSELLHQSKLVSSDASIGLVFPLLFSIAIIIISYYARTIHLCTEAVLLGEIAYAPFDRMIIFNHDIGAKSIYTLLFLLILLLTLLFLFKKELVCSTFDPIFSTIIGFSAPLIHYCLMTIVSLTTVITFQAVGAILVISFMITPASTMNLLVNDTKKMIIGSCLLGTFNSIIGYFIAMLLDTSISGSIATINGLIFFIVFLFSKDGYIHRQIKQKQQSTVFKQLTLLFHLLNHETSKEELQESQFNTLQGHFRWSEKQTKNTIHSLIKQHFIIQEGKHLKLTKEGKEYITKMINTI